MKKMLLTGFSGSVTEESIRSWLAEFAPLYRVDIIRQGNADAPFVVAEMDISDGAAFYLVHRLTNYWHNGCMISARFLMY